MQFVSYLRVSTERQGASGLGLQAQREAVRTYATSRDSEVVAEYVEIESGGRKDRPELQRAIERSRETGAILLIAKLDRLARSVHLISGIMESGVEFVAADNPHASRLMLHLLAAFAEHERSEISARTKAALAAAKSRGVVLGKHGRALAEAARQDALNFAERYEDDLAAIRRAGGRTVRDYAKGLNERGIPSPAGGRWGPGNAGRLLARLSTKSVATDATLEQPG